MKTILLLGALAMLGCGGAPFQGGDPPEDDAGPVLLKSGDPPIPDAGSPDVTHSDAQTDANIIAADVVQQALGDGPAPFIVGGYSGTDAGGGCVSFASNWCPLDVAYVCPAGVTPIVGTYECRPVNEGWCCD
jgi:hypothetical protein